METQESGIGARRHVVAIAFRRGENFIDSVPEIRGAIRERVINEWPASYNTSIHDLNCDHSKDRPNKDSAVRVLELRLPIDHASTSELSSSGGWRRRACPTRLRRNCSDGVRVAIRYDEGGAAPWPLRNGTAHKELLPGNGVLRQRLLHRTRR